MKKLGLIMLILFLASAGLFSQNKLIMNVGDLPPHTSPDMVGNGMLAAILTETLKGKEWSIEYYFYPIARMRQMIESGTIQGTFAAEDVIDKNDFYYVVLQINHLVFFYRKDRFPDGLIFNNFTDLSEYTLGTVRGTPSETAFKNAGMNIESVVNETLNFKKLRFRRIDIIATVNVFGLYQIKTNNFNMDDFGITDPYGKSVSVFAILKSNPIGERVISDIEDGLKELIISGKYLKILETYLGEGNVPSSLIPQ